MVELEVSVDSEEGKMLTPRAISLQAMDFQLNYDVICWISLNINYGKESPKTRTSVFQNMMKFESGFNNFGNIFFTIAGSIYINRQ